MTQSGNLTKKLKPVTGKIFRWLLKPIRNNFIHFAMVFILASGFQIFSQFLMQDPLRMFNVVTMTMWGLIIAYSASAIILVLPPDCRIELQ